MSYRFSYRINAAKSWTYEGSGKAPGIAAAIHTMREKWIALNDGTRSGVMELRCFDEAGEKHEMLAYLDAGD